MTVLTKTLTALVVFTLAANVATARQAQPAPAAKAPDAAVPAPVRPVTPPQLLNIKLDLTITDQRDGSSAPAKTVTLLLEDRQNGRLRTDQAQANARLAVDARPEILPNGRIRVALTLEYRPQTPEADKLQPPMLTESVTAILDDGKALLVSQSADPTAMRIAVKVELKATILR